MEVNAAADRDLAKRLDRILALAEKYRTANKIQQALLDLADHASLCDSLASFFQALATSLTKITQPKQVVVWQIATIGDAPEVVFSTQGTVASQAKADALYAFSSRTCANSTLHEGLNSDYFYSIPLCRGQEVMAVLTLVKSSPFSAAELKRINEFSQYILLIVDRVRSRELLEIRHQRHSRRLSELHAQLQEEILARSRVEELTNALMSLSDLSATEQQLENVIPDIHRSIQKAMNIDGCTFAVQDRQTKKLEIKYFADSDGNPLKASFSALKILQRVARTHKPAILSKAGNNTQWMACPFDLNDDSTGIISVQRTNHSKAFTESEQTLLLFSARQLAFAWHQNAIKNQMLSSNEELEKKIKQRTKDLHTLNESLTKQIDERKKVEEKLFHDAHHDGLTGLPNRALFLDRLSVALLRKRRHAMQNFAVLFIDLDRFKLINDTLGHHAGDTFLIEVARRLQTCIRGNDILARLGGDEFVILLDMLHQTDDAEDIATRVIDCVKQPFELEERTVYSSASIGIALFDKRYSNADEILRDADAAMYQAKAFGRNRYVFFDESMREQLMQELTLEQSLREGIRERQFEPHFQPISELHSKDVIGYEALVRWNHPELGNQLPAEFLELAESTGLILEIDRQIVDYVCKQLAFWQTSGELAANTFISLNLSGKHLANATATTELTEIIKESGVNPFHLIFEFSENSLHQLGENAHRSLRQLAKTGVRLALDNYGSGTSSLNFLHSYPFAFIKIDQSFIRSLQKTPKNEIVISTIQALGEKMGFHLVAEGIENEVLYNKLVTLGCAYGQGYFLSHPQQLTNSLIDQDDDHAVPSCA